LEPITTSRLKPSFPPFEYLHCQICCVYCLLLLNFCSLYQVIQATRMSINIYICKNSEMSVSILRKTGSHQEDTHHTHTHWLISEWRMNTTIQSNSRRPTCASLSVSGCAYLFTPSDLVGNSLTTAMNVKYMQQKQPHICTIFSKMACELP